jgi:hypothetical protein
MEKPEKNGTPKVPLGTKLSPLLKWGKKVVFAETLHGCPSAVSVSDRHHQSCGHATQAALSEEPGFDVPAFHRQGHDHIVCDGAKAVLVVFNAFEESPLHARDAREDEFQMRSRDLIAVSQC